MRVFANRPEPRRVKRIEWLDATVLALAALCLRGWCLHYSDLPAGDEINTYIANAQEFSRSFTIPSLDNFPFTTFLYGTLILLLDKIGATLSGVVVYQVVSIASISCTVFLIYLTLIRLNGSRGDAFCVSLFFLLYPGIHLVFRADISLYFVFAALLSFLLVHYPVRQNLVYCCCIGATGALFYLSRSDGVFVFTLSVAIFLLMRKIRFKSALLAFISFFVTLMIFFGVRVIFEGNVGDGTTDRALVAFYQAEGLHDNLGGSWQDYTQRGMEKFTPGETTRPSLIKIILKHPVEVTQRIGENLRIIRNNIELIWKIPAGVVVVFAMLAFVGRLWNFAVVAAVPVLLTCGIYLFFYYQSSYLTLLSYSLSLLVACGILNTIAFIRKAFPLPRRFNLSAPAMILLGGFFLITISTLYPVRVTTKTRYWDALLLLKKNCGLEQTECFYAPPYRGSNAHYIFADRPMCSVQLANGGEGGRPEDNLAELRQRGIRYALVGRENAGLWSDMEDAATILWTNRDQDVRILKLQ